MNELAAETPLLASATDSPRGLRGDEVFTLDEVSQASGTPVERLQEAASSGALRAIAVGGLLYFSRRDVLAYFQAHRRHFAVAPVLPLSTDASRTALPAMHRPTPFAAAAAVHCVIVAAALLLTARPVSNHIETLAAVDPQEIHLVYLAHPGPGGGGGGGGLQDAPKPTRAMRKGHSKVNSPVPTPEPVPIEPPPPPKPQTLPAESLPAIQAPIVPAPADARPQVGVLDQPPSPVPPAHGPGTGGGAGTGTGTGIGPGNGSGVGPGSGGGTGGGPYRPGSGILPPRLAYEVKPDYTEEARQRNIEGDVTLQIIVRRDGTVGDVRVVRGLGYGLDQRAVEAVRQFRFQPATRLGTPVDVVVTIDVTFELR